jgi:DNA-3-methyladenine glycosylase II
MLSLAHSGVLRPTPPFDFGHALRFLGGFTPTRGEQTLAPALMTKALVLAGQALIFQVQSSGQTERPRLEYRLWSERPLAPAVAEAAADRIAFFLSAADDLGPFYALGRDDPAFAPLVEQLYGYHQVKFLTPFENACWAVLTQRTPMAAAQTMKQALVERFGSTLELEEARYGAFPEAERVAAGAAELPALLGHPQKARYLAAVAQAFAGADEGWLRGAPYAEAEAWLRGIDGIGPWSAAFVLLRGLGRMEQIPLGESALSQAAARRYAGGRTLSPAQLQRIAEPYGPWRGYWAHYLRIAG